MITLNGVEVRIPSRPPDNRPPQRTAPPLPPTRPVTPPPEPVRPAQSVKWLCAWRDDGIPHRADVVIGYHCAVRGPYRRRPPP